MNIPGLIAVLIGVACIAAYLANFFGKKRARGEPPVQARISDSEQSEWRSSGSEGIPSTSYVVKTTFEVPGKGALRHTRHFSTRADANAWAARFESGSWHAVAPHPYASGEIFLQEELGANSPTALVFGILALAGGAAALYFD